MSVKKIQDNKIQNRSLINPIGAGAAPGSTSWVRDPSWPALSTPGASDQIVQGLYAVWPNSETDSTLGYGNFLAVLAIGAYTVEISGPGGVYSTTNTATNTQTNLEINYSDSVFDNSDAPVTFTASTSTVNRTAHGLTNGMTVRFYNILTTTGLTAEQTYYVINSTTDTFQISSTVGGSAVTLTNDGSAKLLPFKIATVKITPQSGQNLTTIDIMRKHTKAGLQTGYSSNWLDLQINMPNGTTFVIGSGSGSSNTLPRLLQKCQLIRNVNTASVTSTANLFYDCNALRQIIIDTNFRINSLNSFARNCYNLYDITINGTIPASTDATSMFENCYSLSSVSFSNTNGITTASNLFRNCQSLTSVPLFDTANVTNMTGMFYGCLALTSVPLFNTANVTNMTNLFYSCSSLSSVPLFNTANVTSMSYMFYSCQNLVSVPSLNTIKVTDMSYMFQDCQSLVSAPFLNTIACTTMTSMFQNCRSLITIPLYNTINVTNMSNMFNVCQSIVSLPLFNTQNVTDMSGAFSACYSLTSVPLFNTTKVINMSSMFSSCYSLTSIPLFDTANVTNMGSAFSSCYSLTSVPLFNTTKVTTMDSMFGSCLRLSSVPLFNTANVTSMSSMFNGARSITSVPLFNTTKVTTMAYMFQSCYSLTSVPLFDTANVTSMDSMFNSCYSLTSVPFFNTVKVNSMITTFQGCSSLISIPPFNTSAVTNFSSTFAQCTALRIIPELNFTAATSTNSVYTSALNLIRIKSINHKVSFAVNGLVLGPKALTELYTNGLVKPATTQTLTVGTTNWGSQQYTKTCSTTSGSAVITLTDTSNLRTGQRVTGTNITGSARTATADVSTDAFTATAHGLSNDSMISFSAIGTVTNIATYTIYYVINKTDDTFQIATTVGGSAIDLTGTGASVSYLIDAYVTNIVTNTSVTLSVPATATGASQSLVFRDDNIRIANLKNWTIA